MISIFALLSSLTFLNPARAMEEEERRKPFAHMGAIFGEPPSGPLTPEQVEWCASPFTEGFHEHPIVSPGIIEHDIWGHNIIYPNIFQFLDLNSLKALRLMSRGFYHATIKESEKYLKEWTLEHPTGFLFVLLQMSPTECIVAQRVFLDKIQEWENTLSKKDCKVANSGEMVVHPREREFDAFMSSNPHLVRFFCKLYANLDPLWDYRFIELAELLTQSNPTLEAAFTQIEFHTHFNPTEFETLAENSAAHHRLKVNLSARYFADYNDNKLSASLKKYLRTTYRSRYKGDMKKAPYWGFYLSDTSAILTQLKLFSKAKDLSPPFIKAKFFFISSLVAEDPNLWITLEQLERAYKRQDNRVGYLNDLAEFRKYINDKKLRISAVDVANAYDSQENSTTALEILETFDDPEIPPADHSQLENKIEFLQKKIDFIFSVPRMDLLEKAEKLIDRTEDFIRVRQQMPSYYTDSEDENEESFSSDSSTEDLDSSFDCSSSMVASTESKLYFQKVLLEIYKGNLITASDMLKDSQLDDTLDYRLLFTALQEQRAHSDLKKFSFILKSNMFFKFKKEIEKAIKKSSKRTTFEKEVFSAFLTKFKPLFSFLRENDIVKEENFRDSLNKLEELYKIS
jgi:hypothetical protein